MLAAANLQNYLDVLSHLTASLLHFRGKLFRSGLNDQNPDGDSDTDSDDEISSTSLGGKFICRVNFFRVYFFRQGFGLGGGENFLQFMHVELTVCWFILGGGYDDSVMDTSDITDECKRVARKGKLINTLITH